MRYYTFFYAFLGFSIIVLTWKFHIPLKQGKTFYLLITANIFLIIVYIKDIDSLINLATLLISYYSLSILIIKGLEYNGNIGFGETIFKHIWKILLISFAISPILTVVNWPNAPEYYPWNAFFSDKRLLLIVGQDVGHSNAMWLMAFSIAYILSKMHQRRGRYHIAEITLLIFLTVALIETEARIGLIFIIILSLGWLCYIGIISKRLYGFVPFIGVAFFVLSITYIPFTSGVINFASLLQRNLTLLRIESSVYNKGEGTGLVFSGRYILNKALISNYLDHPWFGAGNSAMIFKYGVDKEGYIAWHKNKVSGSESGLRLLAKYGSIYYAALMLFIVIPILRSINGYYKDDVFVLSVCNIIIFSAFSGNAFENLYGISGLFVIVLLIFNFMKPCDGNRGANPNKPSQIRRKILWA